MAIRYVEKSVYTQSRSIESPIAEKEKYIVPLALNSK